MGSVSLSHNLGLGLRASWIVMFEFEFEPEQRFIFLSSLNNKASASVLAQNYQLTPM